MGIRALSKRDKMRRIELTALRREVSELRSLLRKRETKIKDLKREIKIFGGGDTGIDSVFAAIY